MIIPDYNIISPYILTIDWSQCRLVIELNGNYFHYIIVQGDEVIALKYYQFTPASGKTTAEWLEEILAADELLQKERKETTVIYNLPDSHLVPENLFNASLTNEWTDLIMGDLKKGVVMNRRTAKAPVYNVFRVPDELHQFFEYNFSPVQYQHYYTVWIEENNDEADAVSVIFYSNELLVKVIADGQLQIIQNYPYQTAEDVGYYLLNIYNQFHLSSEQVPLLVSGMIVTDSPMYEELLKYFLLVKTIPAPAELNLAPDFTLYPEHFFSPILQTALCV